MPGTNKRPCVSTVKNTHLKSSCHHTCTTTVSPPLPRIWLCLGYVVMSLNWREEVYPKVESPKAIIFFSLLGTRSRVGGTLGRMVTACDFPVTSSLLSPLEGQTILQKTLKTAPADFEIHTHTVVNTLFLGIISQKRFLDKKVNTVGKMQRLEPSRVLSRQRHVFFFLVRVCMCVCVCVYLLATSKPKRILVRG